LTTSNPGADQGLTPNADPRPETYNRDQVGDLAHRLAILLADPNLGLPPEERQVWEHVRATAERLVDEFEPQK